MVLIRCEFSRRINCQHIHFFFWWRGGGGGGGWSYSVVCSLPASTVGCMPTVWKTHPWPRRFTVTSATENCSCVFHSTFVLPFHVFVLCVLANSRVHPKNKSKSLGTFNGQEHQNYSTTRTGLQATLHDVKGFEGEKGISAPSNCSCKEMKSWPASWSSGQGLWLLIMRSRFRFPVLPWEFFLAGKVSRGDHGLGSQ